MKTTNERITFIDLEINPSTNQILDIGAIKENDSIFHDKSLQKFKDFLLDTEFIAGHNIFEHDLKYLRKTFPQDLIKEEKVIDTLFLAPLLFPSRPYHNLVKDDKLQVDDLNNPVNDAIKSRELFQDELMAFYALPERLRIILSGLMTTHFAFKGFINFTQYSQPLVSDKITVEIREIFARKFCSSVNIASLIKEYPVELAYALSLINANDKYSIIPPWVLHRFPAVERVLYILRGKPCITGCNYCNEALNPYNTLRTHFGFERFRDYDGVPLQVNAVNAAIHGKSLLAIFPTGGGKSITFQVPALMDGVNTKALTVIISPLQSLMKDQVDNLEKKGITDAVTINGLLDPIERARSIERVAEGSAHILYISPESLRSATIERLLLGRKISRFVIDEAHCFSSWGQDFRVDYLYIGDFIRNLQEKKGLGEPIPVSCFTATAKQKVIEDITGYFKEKLNLTLDIFRAKSSRTNLQYKVFNQNDEEGKYAELRRLLEAKSCPTIIYVSRTKRARILSQRLTQDGFEARAFHGKMDKEEKTENQNAFINGDTNLMVATSAFGMGVDKSDVGMVVHYDISDSLENYVQEAGRAGRDESLTADCFVLFNEEDLNKHFTLLNQTKLNIKEINQIWKAIKDLTKTRDKASNSALEIARKAGWDDNIREIETRVTTAIAALEDAGYLKRGQNMPRVFANSILAKNAQDAIDKINASSKFSEKQKEKAVRIIKKLFSSKSKRLSTEETAESRVDYISDQLGIFKEEVIQIIQLLRDEKILADAKDLTAYIKKVENSNRPLQVTESYKQLEEFLLPLFSEEEKTYNLKELNDVAEKAGIKENSLQKIKTILNFWSVKNWIKKGYPDYSRNHLQVILSHSKEELKNRMTKRHFIIRKIIEYLYSKALNSSTTSVDEILIEFSICELKDEIEKKAGLFSMKATNEDIEDSLFYLSRIDALKIEGGFLVTYNKLTIDRLEKNNKIQYKQEDYKKLNDFYQNKVQQIHIVGEYAKKMVDNYKDALQFVEDYFNLNYSSFLNKYFPGSRQDDIRRTLTPAKFKQLFGSLSPAQLEIIKNSSDQYIVVAAGPGSGKTRVLVHKMASLLLAEDVKNEQLLMLTFSRAAATEFKKRLLDLIGKTAHFIEIKTFHSYCFELLGKIGSLTESDSILRLAIEKIKNGEIEQNKITKTVLVIDEAQDMNLEEFELVKTLMVLNEEMRVILVGDDDQNIFEFRGADSKFMQELITTKQAKKYELIENYRSKANVVSFANQWANKIQRRLKELPIMPVTSENGVVKITQYVSNKLIVPLIQSIQQTELTGSTCILTKTNEEAVQIAGLLTHNGYNAKLIQTNDGFNLFDLQELRYFTEAANGNENASVITEENWEIVKRKLYTEYASSNKLEWCKEIIKEFELANPFRKYKSDWNNFLYESKFEDFVQITSDTIFVSTIHKSKGREYDNVFLLLNNAEVSKDPEKRQLYVAMTRAKSNLHIHYNGSFLQGLSADNLLYIHNDQFYDAPPYMSFSLTHRDVWLGFFENVQDYLNGTMSGTTLNYTNQGLTDRNGRLILRFSKTFKEEIARQLEKGYQVSQAKTNFVVYWKNKDTGKELKIILPEMSFKKDKERTNFES